MSVIPREAAEAGLAPSPRCFLVVVVPPVLAGMMALGLAWSTPEPQAQVTTEGLVLRGEMTFRVPVHAIVDLSLERAVPRVIWREQGSNWSVSRQGRFELESVGPARLMVAPGRPPYARVRTVSDEVFFNLERAGETERVYRELREVWRDSSSR